MSAVRQTLGWPTQFIQGRDVSLLDAMKNRRAEPGHAVEGTNLNKIDPAISIRQPYVELILCGEKREEYRNRPTNIRGRVYLYAAMKPAERKFWIRVRKEPGELPRRELSAASRS